LYYYYYYQADLECLSHGFHENFVTTNFIGKRNGEEAEASMAVTTDSVHRASRVVTQSSVAVSAKYVICKL